MTSSLRICRAAFIASCAALPWAVSAIWRRYLDAASAIRLTGVVAGALLIAWANAMSKMLVPLNRLACEPSREQALRRFCAWAMVLGGLGFLLAFALAPIAIAAPLAMCLLAPPATAVMGIARRCAWKRRGASRRGA